MRSAIQLVSVGATSAIAASLATLAVVRAPGGKSGENGEPSREPLTLVLDASGQGGAATPVVRDISDPRLSLRQLTAIAGRLAAEDPEEAVRRAMEIPGHDSREIYLGEALRAWGERDGAAAAAFVGELFQGRRLADALYYVADGWAEADPAGAAEWFHRNTEGTVLEDAMWEALESWGRKDPAAAFAWSANLDDYERSTAMQGLAEGWGAVDPEGAAAAGLEMKDTGHGRDFLVSVMTQWAGSAPEKAAEWASGILDEELRASLYHELGDMWSETQPERAAAWAASIEDPGSRRYAEFGIAKGWAAHDPGAALEWALGTIGDAAQLDETIDDILFLWSRNDPRGATRWLAEQPPGPKLDEVLSSFSTMAMDDDVEAAVAWASRISAPELRETQLRDLLGSFVDVYGDEAREAIRGFSLPEPLKAEFGAPR